MEQKPMKGRFALLLALVFVVVAVFMVRLIQWQIVQSGMYDSITGERDTYTITGEAAENISFLKT